MRSSAISFASADFFAAFTLGCITATSLAASATCCSLTCDCRRFLIDSSSIGGLPETYAKERSAMSIFSTFLRSSAAIDSACLRTLAVAALRAFDMLTHFDASWPERSVA